MLREIKICWHWQMRHRLTGGLHFWLVLVVKGRMQQRHRGCHLAHAVSVPVVGGGFCDGGFDDNSLFSCGAVCYYVYVCVIVGAVLYVSMLCLLCNK